MNIYSILEKVRNTPGKNDKIAILAENKDFPFLKDFLFYTYAPHLNYYMKKLPKVTAGLNVSLGLEAAASRCVKQLSTRKITGNDAKDFVVDLLRQLSEEDAECLKYLLLRDVKAGMNTSTINKVWPGVIFEAPYMRCSLEAEANPEKWDWQGCAHYVQLKANGMFVNIVRNAGYAKFVTRQGNLFPLGILGQIEEEAGRLFNECVYTGELTVFDNVEQVVLPRTTGNGILNSCLQGGELDQRYSVRCELWDVVPYSSWYKRECRVPYNERLETLQSAIDRADSYLICLIETHEVGSLAEAKSTCTHWMLAGFEGGVLKNAWMPWKDHTSKFQVKVKAEVEVELRAVELVAGKEDGANAATYGSIRCESEDGLLIVDVPGYSKETRQDIFEYWDTHYKNRVMTVKANELLVPGPNNSKHSLFLPRFVEWRYDKNVADDLAKIKAEFAEIYGK